MTAKQCPHFIHRAHKLEAIILVLAMLLQNRQATGYRFLNDLGVRSSFAASPSRDCEWVSDVEEHATTTILEQSVLFHGPKKRHSWISFDHNASGLALLREGIF